MDQRAYKEGNQYEEDLDDIDFGNYKGIFYDDDPTTKYQDPETGAHFDFDDIWMRLSKIKHEKEATSHYQDEAKLSAKEKLRMQLNLPINPKNGASKHARIETEYSDPEDDEEMSILDERMTFDKENINDSNMDEHYLQTEVQQDDMDLLKGIDFKNKFADQMQNPDMLFHRRNHGNDISNPIKFMHKIHQTEEDEENVELIDQDFGLDNLWNFNEDKTNLLEALNSKVS